MAVERNLRNLHWSSSEKKIARAAFDSALAQESILESSQEVGGVHVMTIHRAKGKQ